MKFDPQKHHRCSIRLRGYDYSQAGAYFVTIVAWQRECLFGGILDEEMQLNNYGKMVEKWWYEIPKHFPNVELGAFVIMPNHVHGIIIIHEGCRGTVPVPDDESKRGEMTSPLRAPTLGQIVAYFKYQSTKEMNALDDRGTITKFWQRNYLPHVLSGGTNASSATNAKWTTSGVTSNPIHPRGRRILKIPPAYNRNPVPFPL